MNLDRFSFILGVTGHIDLIPEETPVLIEKTREVLKSLQRVLPQSPIAVLTALADGADQLAAQEAVKLGFPIIALIPMPYAEYRKTIRNQEVFNALWTQTSLRLELPLGEFSAADTNSQEERDKQQYAMLGAVLTRYCHLLLAYWDSSDPWEKRDDSSRHAGLGGTAHVIHMMQTGRMSKDIQKIPFYGWLDRKSLTGYQGRPVIHATCNRVRTGKVSTNDPGTLRVFMPGHEAPQGPSTLAEVEKLFSVQQEWRDLDLANRDISSSKLAPADLDKCAGYLMSDSQVQTLPNDGKGATALRGLFATCDAMALINQSKILKSQIAMVIALPLGVFMFELYTHIFPHSVPALAGYALVLLVSLSFYISVVAKQRWQNKYQDFRALAEALRVQLYWAVGGIADPVIDRYLNNHSGALRWLRSALRGASLHALALVLVSNRPDRELVRSGWVVDQKRYFIADTNSTAHVLPEQSQSSAGKIGHTLRAALSRVPAKPPGGKAEFHELCYLAFKSRATVAYSLVILATLGLFVPELMHLLHDDPALKYWAVSIAVLSAIAAALTIFAEQRAFEDHAHEYARMGQLFALAERKLNEAGTDEKFQSIMRELGEEALAENASWLLLHRKRPIEVIKGG
jgi:hypothetical protein